MIVRPRAYLLLELFRCCPLSSPVTETIADETEIVLGQSMTEYRAYQYLLLELFRFCPAIVSRNLINEHLSRV